MPPTHTAKVSVSVHCVSVCGSKVNSAGNDKRAPLRPLSQPRFCHL